MQKICSNFQNSLTRRNDILLIFRPTCQPRRPKLNEMIVTECRYDSHRTNNWRCRYLILQTKLT